MFCPLLIAVDATAQITPTIARVYPLFMGLLLLEAWISSREVSMTPRMIGDNAKRTFRGGR